jgi:glycosyltransferase involved in cell wall biosynthesis
MSSVTCLQGTKLTEDSPEIRSIGDYVAIINRNISVTNDLLTALIAIFAEFDRVGMVTPQVVRRDEFEKVAVFEYQQGVRIHNRRLGVYCEGFGFGHKQQADYFSQSCAVIATRVWDEICGFDEIYGAANYSDFNLTRRVSEMGYQCLHVPSIKVTCRATECHETVKNQQITSLSKVDRLKLKARWHRPRSGEFYSLDRPASSSVFIDGNRLLFLDFETPCPDVSAGGYAAIKEMQILQSLGYQITFMPKNIEHDGLYTDTLQRMGIECIYAPSYADSDDFLLKRGNEFSVIYITRYHIAQSILPKLRQYANAAKVVLMLADLHFLRELRTALHNKDDEQLSQAMDTRENELAVMRKVDLVLSYSDVEKTVILSHNLASTKVAKCPWVCEIVEHVSGFANRVDIAFLGGFNHTPNVEAMMWFIERVWPTLLNQLPEAQLRIYGSAIPNSIKDLAESNSRIQVLGWVSDVASVYNNCRVFIAPLQSGAGIKGKVIGALAHGVPSVLSDIAVEGIGVCDEIHAFVAASPDEWVNRIMTLYTDQVLWHKMSHHALSFAKRHYSLDNAITQMKAAFSSIGIEPISEPKALVWKGPWRSVAQV